MAAATTVFLVAAAVGTAISAASAIKQGQAQAKAQRFQADLAERDAQRARALATADATEFRRRRSRDLGVQRARYAGSGIDITSGSPLGVQLDTAKEIGFQAQKILAGGEVKGQGLDLTAGLSRVTAREAETAGFINAGTTVLSGAARIGGAAAFG